MRLQLFWCAIGSLFGVNFDRKIVFFYVLLLTFEIFIVWFTLLRIFPHLRTHAGVYSDFPTLSFPTTVLVHCDSISSVEETCLISSVLLTSNERLQVNLLLAIDPLVSVLAKGITRSEKYDPRPNTIQLLNCFPFKILLSLWKFHVAKCRKKTWKEIP